MPNLDAMCDVFQVQSEINFINFMINNLDPNSPSYLEEAQHHRQQIEFLEQRKQQIECGTLVGSDASNSTPETPADSASTGSSVAGYASRKRSYPPDANVNDNDMMAKRRNDNTNSMYESLQLAPMHPQFEVAGGFSNQPDPFPELNHAFRGLNNGHDLFNETSVASDQGFMSSNELARFLDEPSDFQSQQARPHPSFAPQLPALSNLLHDQHGSASYSRDQSSAGFHYGSQQNRIPSGYQPAVQPNWDFQQGGQLASNFQFGNQQASTFQFGNQPAPGMYTGNHRAPGIPSSVLFGIFGNDPRVPDLGNRYAPLGGFDSEDENGFETGFDQGYDNGTVSGHLEDLIEGIADDEEIARELREETPRIMSSTLMGKCYSLAQVGLFILTVIRTSKAGLDMVEEG